MHTFTAATIAVALIASGGVAAAQTSANPNAGQNAAIKSPDVAASGAPSKGANSFTKKQAADRISKAGYAVSGDLTKDKDGLWHGQATKDGKTVDVSLDFKGNVNAQ